MNSLQKRADEQLTQYVSRGKVIWTDLVAAGYNCEESEVTLSVLAGLPSEYDMIVTVLTATDENLALDDIIPKLLPVEQKLSQQRETITAYSAKGDNRRCYRCGKVGHVRAQCKENKKVYATCAIAF